METFKQRLARFLMGDELEIPETLLNSINNFLLTELKTAAEAKAWTLVFFGMHATMQTVGERIYGLEPRESTRFFLENFVDGPREDLRFSLISDQLHDIRNIGAHQWFGRAMHEHVLDAQQREGWCRVDSKLSLNPDLYFEGFLGAFDGPIWSWEQYTTPEELFARKYDFLVRYAGLGAKDPLARRVRKLVSLPSGPERDQKEQQVRAAFENLCG